MPRHTPVTLTTLALAGLLTACSTSGGNITASSTTGATSSTSAASSKTSSTSSSTAPATQITDLAIGSEVTARGTDDQDRPFEVTVRVKSTKTVKSVGQFLTPKQGEFLGVQVQYVCKKGTCTYNIFDFTLRNKDGETLDQSYGIEPALSSGTLHKGVKAQGWVTFDVKPKQTLSLEYQISSLDDDVASWVVKS